MTTKKQKQEARDLVRQFQEHRHFQRLMEAYLNFDSDTDDEELQAADYEFVEALEWCLYTLKKQFVTLTSYSVHAKDEKHERAVSRLTQELLAIPAKLPRVGGVVPKKPVKPALRVIEGGKS